MLSYPLQSSCIFFAIKKSEISSFSGVFAYCDHILKLAVLLTSSDGLCMAEASPHKDGLKLKDKTESGMEHMCEIIYNIC